LVLVEQAWSGLAQILGLIQWFIIVVTGRRNEDIFLLQRQYIGFAARTYTYMSFLYDAYPPIGDRAGETGLALECTYEEQANRVTTLFRLILAIPALLLLLVLAVGALIVAVVAWFVILFTAKMPEGLFRYLLKVHQLGVRFNAYLLLMTDTYPRFG
jgi:hypothetical protein